MRELLGTLSPAPVDTQVYAPLSTETVCRRFHRIDEGLGQTLSTAGSKWGYALPLAAAQCP